jgi:hypothetical protein
MSLRNYLLIFPVISVIHMLGSRVRSPSQRGRRQVWEGGRTREPSSILYRDTAASWRRGSEWSRIDMLWSIFGMYGGAGGT